LIHARFERFKPLNDVDVVDSFRKVLKHINQVPRFAWRKPSFTHCPGYGVEGGDEIIRTFDSRQFEIDGPAPRFRQESVEASL